MTRSTIYRIRCRARKCLCLKIEREREEEKGGGGRRRENDFSIVRFVRAIPNSISKIYRLHMTRVTTTAAGCVLSLDFRIKIERVASFEVRIHRVFNCKRVRAIILILILFYKFFRQSKSK